MPWTDRHLSWLVQTARTIRTRCGIKVPVWELRHEDEPEILSAWARHLRNHYCLDSDIDVLRHGTPLSRRAYLETLKFPDRSQAPGPSIRSGDFAEILIADYLQYKLDYWVPRGRYRDKAVRNESTKGCDVLGFKFVIEGKTAVEDTLAIFESKAQLSALREIPRLQDAIDDSGKDHLRRAESLNAIKQRLHAAGRRDEMARIERFQSLEDRPYTELFGAAAVFSTDAYDENVEALSDTSNHPNREALSLIVVHGVDLMTLTHALFQRAADEA